MVERFLVVLGQTGLVTLSPGLTVSAIVLLVVLIALFGQRFRPFSLKIFGSRVGSWLLRYYVFFLVFLGTVFFILTAFHYVIKIPRVLGDLIVLLEETVAKASDDPREKTALRGIAYAIGSLVAAVTLFAAVPFTLVKTWINERNTVASEQGLITDRITKAVEQLGSVKVEFLEGREVAVPNIELRTGALISLERIARDSRRDYIGIIDIICSYIRENALSRVDEEKTARAKEELGSSALQVFMSIRSDVQAALFILGRRTDFDLHYERSAKSYRGSYRLDLRGANLSRADFTNANLGPVLFDYANLQGASFRGANLDGADFLDANVAFSGVKDADLTRCNNLSNEQIGTMFGDASSKVPVGSELGFDSEDVETEAEYQTRWIVEKRKALLIQ